MLRGFNRQRMLAFAPHLLNCNENPQLKRKGKERRREWRGGRKTDLSLPSQGKIIVNSSNTTLGPV